MMMKALTAVLALVVLVALLFGAAYWGQQYGIKSSTRVEATYLPMLQNAHECVVYRDWECVESSQEFLATLMAERLQILHDNGLVDPSVAESIEDYLSWYDANIAD